MRPRLSILYLKNVLNLKAGVLGCIGLALAISKDRYGLEQQCEIDVAQSLLNGLGALFVQHEEDWLSRSSKMMRAVQC
jgi:hypothetical protein